MISFVIIWNKNMNSSILPHFILSTIISSPLPHVVRQQGGVLCSAQCAAPNNLDSKLVKCSNGYLHLNMLFLWQSVHIEHVCIMYAHKCAVHTHLTYQSIRCFRMCKYQKCKNLDSLAGPCQNAVWVLKFNSARPLLRESG